MPKITISYRRADSDAITGRIFDRLVARYGKRSVFRDIDNNPIGFDFRDSIGRALQETDILLAVVGPHWAAKGTRHRIREEGDPVRVELEAALQRGIPVIPILVSGAEMPDEGDLPDTIGKFAYHHAATIDSGVNFDNDMDRLIRSLDEASARTKRAEASKPAENPADGVDETIRLPSPIEDLRTQVSSPAPDFRGTFPARTLAALNHARKLVPVIDFAIGYASGLAVLAALLMGFVGLGRASLAVFCAVLAALLLVTLFAHLIAHRNRTVAKGAIAGVWAVSSAFVLFLMLTLTSVSPLKWPYLGAELLGVEVEAPICFNPKVNQVASSCRAGGDWIVAGLPFNDSDGVVLTVRSVPVPNGGSILQSIPPTATEVAVDDHQCSGEGAYKMCRVRCAGTSGWSQIRFLSHRTGNLREVIGADPRGVSIRRGPDLTCEKRASAQNGDTVIFHGCDPTLPRGSILWCRVTYSGISGWVPSFYLGQEASVLPNP